MKEIVKKSLMINSVLLFTDIGAGMILYNYGKSAGQGVSFRVPPKKEFWNMVWVAAVTSVITALAINKVEDLLKVEIFDDTDGAYITESWDEMLDVLGISGEEEIGAGGKKLERKYNLKIDGPRGHWKQTN